MEIACKGKQNEQFFLPFLFVLFFQSLLTHSWRLCCDIPYICVEITSGEWLKTENPDPTVARWDQLADASQLLHVIRFLHVFLSFRCLNFASFISKLRLLWFQQTLFKIVHYVVWMPYIFMIWDLSGHARMAYFSMRSSNPNVSQKGP